MPRKSHPRSGRYIQQPTGYEAFIPAEIPPDPPVHISSELLAATSSAKWALGRLDGSTEILPNPDLFIFMYVRKEAVLSSQIEGTQASLVDVLQFEAAAMDDGNPQDIEEVVNYVNAMNYGLERRQTFPLSLRLIREIHAKLLAGVRGSDRHPGEFRTTQNWIGPAGCTLADALFVPPPPHEMMRALDNLEKFLHDSSPMPQLMKAGIAHAQFETIHPFLDGNGRMGRLLITFLLCQKGILQHPLLYLSHYFKLHRSEYYDRLQAVREQGDWEGWLQFFLAGVYEVAQEATDTARQIVNLREKHRDMVQQTLRRGAGKGLALLEMLHYRPIVTVKYVAENVKLTFANANELVKEFVDLGILAETTGRQRNRQFSFEPYLALFKEGTEP
ncbi:MAG: Fic family protein [Acidobacteriota bacterium]